jgi:outer membrane biosynthesis protein TonB
MDCSNSDRIAAHAEGRLGEAESAELLDHCSACDDCRRELALVALLQARGERPVAVPPDVQNRAAKAVLRSLERDRERTPRHLRFIPRERKSPVGLVAAAALIVALGGMIALLKMRGPVAPRETVKRSVPAPEAPREETVVHPTPAPRAPEPPPRREVVTRQTPAPPVARIDDPKPVPVTDPIEDRPEPPPVPEPRPETVPAKPSHTVVARALTEIQVTDATGSLVVRRKGGAAKEKLGAVARLSEGDVVTAEKTSSFQVDGRHPMVLSENAQVSLAYAPAEQAPWLHLRGGEAMVDSTGPTRWVVSDGRVSVVIKQARARFATAPGEDRLVVTALSEPLYVQPDGGRVHAIRPGEELQVGRERADVRGLDAQVVARKAAAFEQARPKQRTVFFTSCDPADAKREHVFVQEGAFFRNEALMAADRKDRTAAVTLSPNPRFTWKNNLVLRFRFRTNAQQLQVSFRVDERGYLLYKSIPVDRKTVNQWLTVEVPFALGGLAFRRDDGQNQLVVDWQDKFDWLRFQVAQVDVFGDQKLYLLVDDLQVVEKE